MASALLLSLSEAHGIAGPPPRGSSAKDDRGLSPVGAQTVLRVRSSQSGLRLLGQRVKLKTRVFSTGGHVWQELDDAFIPICKLPCRLSVPRREQVRLGLITSDGRSALSEPFHVAQGEVHLDAQFVDRSSPRLVTYLSAAAGVVAGGALIAAGWDDESEVLISGIALSIGSTLLGVVIGHAFRDRARFERERKVSPADVPRRVP